MFHLISCIGWGCLTVCIAGLALKIISFTFRGWMDESTS
jgi:hypothetical protein